MKLLFLFLFPIFSFLDLKSQNVVKYEYFTQNNEKIIPPTYMNLVGLVLSEENQFVNTLKQYGYEVSYNYVDYVYQADIWSNKELYSIRKRGNQIWMLFTPDRHGFVQKITNDLDRKGISSTNIKGIKEYNLTINIIDNYQCKLVLAVSSSIKEKTTIIDVRIKKE